MMLGRRVSGAIWLKGWRRKAVAFACGVAGTLALPPFFWFELLIPAYAGLFWLIHTAPDRKRAFWDGWWWGWGHYMSGLYWFCIALLTEPEKFAWLIPFTLFGLNAVIALYSATASLLVWLALRRIRGVAGIAVFSTIWTLVEVARGHWFTGFPWNLPGYSLAFSDATLQLASLIGVYGMSWVAVFLGVSPVAALLMPRRRLLLPLLALGAFAIAGFWGVWRLQAADALPESERYVDGVTLRLVQANIQQAHKWDPELQLKGLQEHVRLSQSPGAERVTHIIWPETALPFVFKPHTPLAEALGQSIPSSAYLITGALRAEGQGEAWRIWNSMVAIDHRGELVGHYDKAKLVPFGEFLPFRSLFPKAWLTPVGDTDFSSGEGTQSMQWPGLPLVSPLICYEVIFPGLAVNPDQRPHWLLNLTNDAWFGMSTGPHQHFHMARMRAVEQGLPLVRVANTGITAVIDGYGRVVSSLALGTKGVLDSPLPKSLAGNTTYARFNNWFLLFVCLLTSFLIILQYKTRKN